MHHTFYELFLYISLPREITALSSHISWLCTSLTKPEENERLIAVYTVTIVYINKLLWYSC